MKNEYTLIVTHQQICWNLAIEEDRRIGTFSLTFLVETLQNKWTGALEYSYR